MLTIYNKSVSADDLVPVENFVNFNNRFSPNRDSSTIYFKLNNSATVSLNVINNSGNVVRNYYKKRNLTSGAYINTWYGDNQSKSVLPAGTYYTQLDVETESVTNSYVQKVVINKTPKPVIGDIGVIPRRVSPNNDGFNDKQEIFFTVSENCFVDVAITKNGTPIRWVAKRKYKSSGKIRLEVWNGLNYQKKRVPGGEYNVRVLARNKAGYSIKKSKIYVTYGDTNWRRDRTRILSSVKSLRSKNLINSKKYKAYVSIVQRSERLLSIFRTKKRKNAYNNLGNVFKQIANVSRSGRLTTSRAYYLIYVTLNKNNNYFYKHNAPKSWTVFYPGENENFAYIYIPSKGLQPHPHHTIQSLIKRKNDKDLFLRNTGALIPAFENRYYNSKRFKTYDYQFEYMLDKEFWPSSLSQSGLLTVLSLAYKFTGDVKYLNISNEILESFNVPYTKGGLLDTDSSGRKWFLIYNKTNSWKVLNGHMIALDRLRSYASQSSSTMAYELFRQGTKSLIYNISKYDFPLYKDFPSLSKYSIINYPANSNYHNLNLSMAKKLSKFSNQASYYELLDHFANKWQSGEKVLLNKTRMYKKNIIEKYDENDYLREIKKKYYLEEDDNLIF